MTGRLKRALWCRWFHRYRWRHGKKPASVTSTLGGQSLRLTAGPGRTFCDACENHEYGRALRQWLASLPTPRCNTASPARVTFSQIRPTRFVNSAHLE